MARLILNFWDEIISAAPSPATASWTMLLSHLDRSATLAFWESMAPALIGLTLFTFVLIVWGFLLF